MRCFVCGDEGCWLCRPGEAVVRVAPPPPSRRLVLAAEARRLADEEGLNLREIRERLGVSRSYAHELLNDPDGSKARARKESYRGRCEVCGKQTTGGDGPTKAPRLCLVHAAEARAKWTPETIVARFRAFYAFTGRPPTAEDGAGHWSAPTMRARRSPRRQAEIDAVPASLRPPASSTVREHFPSWRAALEAAGLPRSPTGGTGHRR